MGYLIVWGMISIFVMLCMINVTNKRESGTYQWNKCIFALLAVFTGISLVCGYIIGLKSVSEMAEIRLTISYFIILGAAVIDWKLHIIPNFLSGTLVGARVVLLVFEIIQGTEISSSVLDSGLGAVLCILIINIANKFSKDGIGKGDLKLLMALGFMCGTHIVFTVFLYALICCSVFTVILIALKKATIKEHLAFGPFIYAGYVVMLLCSI